MSGIFNPPAVATKISLTQNMSLQEVGGLIVTASGTVTGTAGFGSSLFLQRLFLPAAMSLTEIDLAMGLSFPATNQGAGTMSQSFVLYSFGNSSSLASVMSTSATFAWSTGTSTTAGAASLTQFQGGWSIQKLHPMTFGSTSVSAGEYVVGNLLNFAQATSTWTIGLLGALASITNSTTISNVTSINTTGASGISNAGTAQVAFLSNAGTAQLVVLSNAGTGAVNNYELSSNTFAGSAVSAMATATSISTKTFSVQPRTLFTATPTVASRTVFSAAPTAISETVFTVAPTQITAVSTVSGVTQSIVPQYLTAPNLLYIGTGSTTSALPSVFIAGIMSTGAIPTAITLTSTAVTYFSTAAGAQPYFALIGS